MDLKKILPRIPLVALAEDARAFADAGRKLADLHVGYETVEPYPLNGLDSEPTGDPYEFYAVSDKKMRFGDKGKDRTVIHFNDRITLSGFPEEVTGTSSAAAPRSSGSLTATGSAPTRLPASSTTRTTGRVRSATRATSSTSSPGS